MGVMSTLLPGGRAKRLDAGLGAQLRPAHGEGAALALPGMQHSGLGLAGAAQAMPLTLGLHLGDDPQLPHSGQRQKEDGFFDHGIRPVHCQ